MFNNNLINFVILFVAFAGAVEIKKCNICDGRGNVPISVDFEDCTKEPCSLEGGKNVAVTFKADRNVAKVKHLLKARVNFGIIKKCMKDKLHAKPAEDYIFQTNGEKAQFPLVKGQTYAYKRFLPDPSAVSMTIESVFALLDENSKPLFCYQLSINTN